MKSFLQNDLLFRYRENSHLGSQDHISVFHYIISGRTKAVSVQYSAQQVAVRKYNRSRAVPGLHHSCVILVEIPDLLRKGLIVGPGFRNGDHHCQRQIHTAHYQEFQSIVQHGRIRSLTVYHRKDLVKLIL